MKYNDKQFYQSTTEAFEVQEMNNGAKVELHYMDDEPFYMDNINRSRFSEWSTPNGKDYKLFIDKGLYDVTKDLYTKEVNEVWMEFWDRLQSLRKKVFFFFLFPLVGVFFAIFITLSLLFPNQILYLLIALGVLLVIYVITMSMFNKKAQAENIAAAARVRDAVGLDKFKGLIEDQQKYIEKYYEDLQKKYEEEDRLAEMEANGEVEATDEEADEEVDETTEDSSEEVEEAEAELVEDTEDIKDKEE